MKDFHGKRALASALLVLSLLYLLPLSAAAEQPADGRTVRAAVYNNSTLAYQDKDGVWRGTDVECLLNIAQREGFTVEFIDSANDPDFLENLDSGKYDIVCDVIKTPEREAHYLFNDAALGVMDNTLSVRQEDDRWDYGNIAQISDMRIGVLSSYANNAEFRDWCARRGLTPALTEYESIENMTAALAGGEIDGEIYSMMYGQDYTKNFRTILQLLPETYYYTFRQDDMALKAAVDEGLAQILMENRHYLSDLNDKYNYLYGSDILPMSAAEKQYVSENPEAAVAVLADDAPYFTRRADGTAGGIVPDYYAELAGYTGLRFTYLEYGTQAEAIAAVQSGEADVLGIYSGGIVSGSGEGLALTASISEVSSVLLAKAGTSIADIRTIAIKQRAMSALTGIDLPELANAQLQGFETAGDCFQALKNDRTEAAILGLPSATWLINQTNSSAYSLLQLPGITFELCSAVRKEKKTLCSVLNKGIAATKSNFDSIVATNTLQESGLWSFLNHIPIYSILLISAVLLALVIGLVWTLILLRHRQKERSALLAAQAETQQQRIRAQAMEKSAEEKNAFFSNISHDMRTPLNAVIGFAGMGEKEEDVGKKNEYFSKIKFSGELLNSLIDDTLTISKINSGKLELHPEPTRPLALLSTVIDLISQAAAKKGVTFTADTSGAADRVVLIDRLNMQKICLNLLSNAIKYTPAGGHVRLRLFNDPGSGGQPDSVFEVSDDGIGISPEFLPDIFEPFAQERRHGYESVGTGLGLSIVKQLVDLMGGTVQVRSELNRGSTFTVRLHFEPAAQEEVPASEKTPQGIENLSGRRVLLCEDNELNREIAVAVLREQKMETVTAENGAVGLQKFAQSAEGEYAVILMDIRMPVLDGYETARRIRAMERPDAKTIPIIAMTADAFADDVRKCLSAGMNGHIAKPIDPEKLYRQISLVLTGGR